MDGGAGHIGRFLGDPRIRRWPHIGRSEALTQPKTQKRQWPKFVVVFIFGAER